MYCGEGPEGVGGLDEPHGGRVGAWRELGASLLSRPQAVRGARDPQGPVWERDGSQGQRPGLQVLVCDAVALCKSGRSGVLTRGPVLWSQNLKLRQSYILLA